MADNNQSVFEAQNENFKRHDEKIDKLSEAVIHLQTTVNGSQGNQGLTDRVKELETGTLAKINSRSNWTFWLVIVGTIVVPFLIYYLENHN